MQLLTESTTAADAVETPQPLLTQVSWTHQTSWAAVIVI